jgi:hypothetical protein
MQGAQQLPSVTALDLPTTSNDGKALIMEKRSPCGIAIRDDEFGVKAFGNAQVSPYISEMLHSALTHGTAMFSLMLGCDGSIGKTCKVPRYETSRYCRR